jgi:hypothetical protein
MTDSAKTSSAQAQEPSSNDDSRIVTSAHHHHRHHHHYPQPQIIYVLANPQDLPLNAYSQSWPHPQQAPAAVMPQVTPLLPPPPPAAHAPIPNHIQQSSICTTVVDDCCADCCPVAASETNGEQPVSEVQTSAPACCSPTMESQRMTAVPYAIRPPNLHHFQSLRPIAPYTMASAAPPVNMNSVTSAISHFHGQHNVFTTHTPKLTTPQTQHGQPQRHSHSVSPPKSPTGASPERSKTPSTEDLQASQKTRNNIDRPSQAAVQDKVTNDQSNSDMETPDSNITVDGTNNNESVLAESAESSLTALSEAAVAAADKQRNDLTGHKRKLDEQQGEARCLWAACAAVFKCIDDVIPHLTKLHVGSRSIKASNQCRWEQCKTEKEDTDELISHVCQDHLGTLELKHGCHWRDCDTRFDSFDDLTDHLSERHIGTGKSQYVCSWEECERQGRAFNQRQKVMRHIQTHTGIKRNF